MHDLMKYELPRIVTEEPFFAGKKKMFESSSLLVVTIYIGKTVTGRHFIKVNRVTTIFLYNGKLYSNLGWPLRIHTLK